MAYQPLRLGFDRSKLGQNILTGDNLLLQLCLNQLNFIGELIKLNGLSQGKSCEAIEPASKVVELAGKLGVDIF